MRKLFLPVLLAIIGLTIYFTQPVPVNAQGAQTVFVTVYSALTSAPVTSAPFTNIGQSAHLLTIKASNRGASSCTNPISFTNLEASSDGTNWFSISPRILVDSTSTFQLTAYGAYPKVRVHIYSLDATCQLSVFYTGALYPGILNGVNTFANAGYSIQNIAAVSNTGTKIIGTGGTSGLRWVLYGISIISPVAPGAGNKLSIFEDVSGSGDCSTLTGAPTFFINQQALLQYASNIWQASSIPIYRASTNDSDMCAITDGNVVAFNLTFIYRYE